MLAPAAALPRRAAGLVAAGLGLIGAFAAGCAPSTPPVPRPDLAAQEAAWTAWRTDRDALYRSDQSPLPDSLREGFGGLAYFDYDSTLAFALRLQPLLDGDTITMQTSTGEPRAFVRYGFFSFETGGQRRRLLAFRPVGPLGEGRLFIPFRDGTASEATYGGGRYLDLVEEPGGTYALDFNFAYHPYCVVNAAYSCPIPPPENRLDVPLAAGERLMEGWTPAVVPPAFP